MDKKADHRLGGCLPDGGNRRWLVHTRFANSGGSRLHECCHRHGACGEGGRPGVRGAQTKRTGRRESRAVARQTQSDPKNPELLTSIGNIYYDAQQYPIAIDHYTRALKVRPSDAAVRTDMATAYWYMGNADSAIAEFNKALTYAPNNPNTLFNLGLVKWKGKMDSAGALADWQKLLAANPNYEERGKVKEMIAEVKKQAAGKP